MPNRRPHDHLVTSKFKVEIEGVTQGAFAAMEGIESTTEVVHYADGDDIIERKRPGRTRYSNIVLKRGFVNTDEPWNWYKNVIHGKIERKSGSIILAGDDGSEIMRYNFFEALPCRWKSFVLNASSQTKSIVEELEIAVEKVERG
ncbi:MAG: phage tail-like protein [Gammaproteobacteria bacterium]|jgi:phage tail-like protein